MTDYKKSKLPFNIVSSSANTGYITEISSGFKPGVDIIGHHQDTYAGLENQPLQSPFTNEHVGGNQHRHAPLNAGADNDFSRAEAFKIKPESGQLKIYGPDFEDVNKPRAQIWLGAKSSINVSNVQSSGNIAGNFEHNYQVVQSSGRRITNNLIVDGFEASGNLTTQFITGAHNYTLPDIIRIDAEGKQYKDQTTFVERFNAPGGKEESSRGALDRAGEELSPNNSLTTRNIKVRQPLYSQLTQHSAQFGSGSSEGISIHKVNRNSLRRIELDGDNYVSSSLYDNFWVQHSIPRDNFGYAWITGSSISNPYTIGTGSLQYDFSSSLSDIKDKVISLDTQTINASLSGSDNYYSTWKQTRTTEHPVARKLKENNIIAVEDQSFPSISRVGGNQNISKRSGTSTNYKETPVTNKFYPIEQNIQFVDEPDGQSTNIKYTYNNNASRFANEDLDIRLGLTDKQVDFYKKLVDAKNLTTNSPIKSVISLKFSQNVYPKELNTYLSGTRNRTQYILDQSGFSRDGYDIQLGTQRVFWRDSQINRKRSANSAGGYINSLGYSSLEESGSNYIQNDTGILFDNSLINLSGTLTQNTVGLDGGINNSILTLESGSSERELFAYTGSFRSTLFNNSNVVNKVSADIVKRGYTSDVTGEFNNSFIDFYEQFTKNNVKQSIGTIYRNTSYKSMLNGLPKARENLLDVITQTDDEEIFSNPRPKYVAFVGGGELNTGSVFDNVTNFSSETKNTYIFGANNTVRAILPVGNKVYFGGDFTSIGGIAADYIAVYDKATQAFSTVGTSSFIGSTVKALVVSGTDIYAGGNFSTPGLRVARYSITNNTWSALSGGLGGPFDTVNALVVSGTDIYAGGQFTPTGSRVSKWSTLPGGNWLPLNGGLNGEVNALVVSGTDIYAGGSFTGISGSRVSRWSIPDGTWSPLSGGLSSTVNTLVISGTDIYAGGAFFTGVKGRRVSRWSTTLPGGDWTALSGGLDNTVDTLVVSGTDIYAGGLFTITGSRVSMWSTLPGGDWSPLSGGLGGALPGVFTVKTLVVSGVDIYAGGTFTVVSGSRVSKLSTLPGGDWSLFNTGDSFSTYNKTLLNTIVTTSSSILFSTLDNGLQNKTTDFTDKKPFYDTSDAFYQNDIYKIAKDFSVLPEFKISEHMRYYVSQSGGNFNRTNNSFLSIDGVGTTYKSSDTQSSSIDIDFLERYAYTDTFNKQIIEDDYSQQLVQDKISINIKGTKKLLPHNGFYPKDRTTQLANLYGEYVDNVLDGGLYNLNNINDYYDNRIISGNYTGSVTDYVDIISNINAANYLNKYFLLKQDNNYNTDGAVDCCVISGSDIYVGGNFITIGNILVKRVAKYNTINKSWSALSGGLSGEVKTLVVSGTDIYAGGLFFGGSGSCVSKWSTLPGGNWEPLSGGLDNSVRTLVVSGTDIYAGGAFGSTGSYVSKWSTLPDGNWEPLSGGLQHNVNTLVISGTDIYAGGFFNNASGSRVSRWSTLPGGNWEPLSGGLSGEVKTLVVSGTDIYAGGDFFTGISGSRVSRWSTLPGVGKLWSPLSGGLSDSVRTLVVSGTDIYAGGLFFTGISGSRVSRWSTLPGGDWTALSGGLDSTVTTLIVSGADIYAGGIFTAVSNGAPTSNFVEVLAVANTSYSIFDVIPSTKTDLYSSSQASYKEFIQTPILSLDGGYHNAKLVSSSNGLNNFSIGFVNGSVTEKSLFSSVTTNGSTWTSPTSVVSAMHPNDRFGEYWDYVYSSGSSGEKIYFAIASTTAFIGSKTAAGAVSFVSATMNTALDGSKSFSYSNKVTIGTGSAAFNMFGTGVSMISCSTGYQMFMGELYGDTNSTNFGNIWVATSSNGDAWSTPVSILSGSAVSSSIGYNNIKAVNFTKDNVSKTYVFFTEPFSSGSVNVQGKFFVISSSLNNNWGTTNINSQKTELYSVLPSTTTSGTLFDVTGSNTKSIEAYANENSITYCLVNGIEDSEEQFSEILIGSTFDGTNWQKNDQMFRKLNNVRGCDVVGMSTYEIGASKFPVFFTNISSSAGVNSIYALTNNQYTQYTLNISGTEKYVKQAALEPVMSPGILYNSIKSGIAVDWACATGSQIAINPYGSGTIVSAYYPQSFKMADHQGENLYMSMYGNLRSNIDYRIDFEKLIFPNDIFPQKNQLTASLIKQTALETLDTSDELVQFISGCYIYGGYEPYTSPVDFSDFNQVGPKRFSVPFVYRKETAKDSGLYSLAMSNFLAETVKFFLKDELLTSFQSKPENKWEIFEKDKKYYMDIVISKSPDLVMMEAYHSDKHPTGTLGEKMNGRYFGYPVNKTTKKLWSEQAETLFTDEQARLIHNDPAYAPYTPPYFEGKATARLLFVPSNTKRYTLDEILSGIVITDIFPGVARGALEQSDAYINKMPVDASVNIKGKLPSIIQTTSTDGTVTNMTDNTNNSWTIGTKFETPVLDFSSESLVPYENNYSKTSGYGRGMWSGYGDIPNAGKGISVSIEESFPQKLNSTDGTIKSLLQIVGFEQTTKEIGLVANKKQISEAVMIIPFIEKPSTSNNNKRTHGVINGSSKLSDLEKQLNIEFIGVDKDIYKKLTKDSNAESSIINTVNGMKKYIVPPQLDYVKNRNIDPFVAYIAEFNHTLSQQDLANIWQGVSPEIATKAEFESVTLSHSNSENEFFHGKGMPNNIRFMVFKIKQKGEFDYFKVTKDSSDDLNFSFEQKIGRKLDDYSYNWPYDYFSLVELAKVDVEINYKKKDK